MALSPKTVKQLVLFAFVGSVGFVIDAGILTILANDFSINLYVARAISFPVASFATWMLNRMFTFKNITGNIDAHSAEYLRYMLVQMGGGVINLLVFAILVTIYTSLRAQPVLPLAIGAVFGLAFNFVGARYWVYPPRERDLDQL